MQQGPVSKTSRPELYATTKRRKKPMMRRSVRRPSHLSETLIGPGAVSASARGTGVYLDKYRVVAEVGRGSMGVVYRGEHMVTGRKVAIKLLQPQHVNTESVVSRFLAEATACARIGHPGIVDIYDAATCADGSAYLVMEFLDGRPLSELIRGRRIAARDTVDLARQMAVTLAAAHNAGIVHRDLKPDNVFVVRDPWERSRLRIKVIDFGVAKFLYEQPNRVKTVRGTVMGTPVYMSPEQAAGSGGLDTRSDIYSLGCILYEAICGRVPFSGTVADVLMGHLHGKPLAPRQIASDAPAALNDLVVQMLAKRPDDRPRTMLDVDAALQAIEASHSSSTATAEARYASSRSDAMDAGADGFIPKPFGIDALREELDRLA